MPRASSRPLRLRPPPSSSSPPNFPLCLLVSNSSHPPSPATCRRVRVRYRQIGLRPRRHARHHHSGPGALGRIEAPLASTVRFFCGTLQRPHASSPRWSCSSESAPHSRRPLLRRHILLLDIRTLLWLILLPGLLWVEFLLKLTGKNPHPEDRYLIEDSWPEAELKRLRRKLEKNLAHVQNVSAQRCT
ncbi:hypothetical protein B0H16DRAFT_151731 [Mycena metata]|uniref:Uncharacterized protein n=1 Tax=Mycena metata TaxID=1033252 RepID=A0AAD7I5I3_9AGAR|nr:hypothetical protein B0H16DRAFT_151731 [Mycena metata]